MIKLIRSLFEIIMRERYLIMALLWPIANAFCLYYWESSRLIFPISVILFYSTAIIAYIDYYRNPTVETKVLMIFFIWLAVLSAYCAGFYQNNPHLLE